MALNEEIRKLASIFKSYAKYSHLGSDGLNLIFQRILLDERIAYTVSVGITTYENRTTPAHTWIDLIDNGLRVDYWLQRWLGGEAYIPHGIFDPNNFTSTRYEGNVVEMPVLSWADIDKLFKEIPLHEVWRSQWTKLHYHLSNLT